MGESRPSVFAEKVKFFWFSKCLMSVDDYVLSAAGLFAGSLSRYVGHGHVRVRSTVPSLFISPVPTRNFIDTSDDTVFTNCGY